MATSVMMSCWLARNSNPSMQFLVSLITSKSTEMMTGKLRTGMRIPLLFARAAIPDSKVSEAEKPREANTMTQKKSDKSSIGFPKKSEKSPRLENDRMAHNRKL